MTLQSNKNSAIRTGFALALALAIWSPVQAQSNEPSKAPKTTTDPTKVNPPKMDPSKADPSKMDHSKMDHSKMDHSKMDHSKMDPAQMEHSKAMMDRCQGMMAEMKAQDTELADQIAKMNNATKDAKVDMMAEIITHMAEQRTATNAKMADMHMEMMNHMQMGMGSKPHDSKMKGMEMKSDGMPKEPK